MVDDALVEWPSGWSGCNMYARIGSLLHVRLYTLWSLCVWLTMIVGRVAVSLGRL